MDKRKYRFVVRQSGIDHALFGFFQTPDKSLLFHLPLKGFRDINTGRLLTELHFSAHSKQWQKNVHCDGNRMTVRFRDDSGQPHTTVVVREQKRHPLIWRIVTVAASVSASPSKPAPDNATNARIEVQAVPPASSVVYTIWVADADVQMPDLQGFSKIVRRFDELQACIYMSILRKPDPSIQAASINSQFPLVSLDPTPAKVVKPSSLESIERQMQEASGTIAAYLLNKTEPWPGQITGADFARWPDHQSAEEIMFGEAARIRNDGYIAKRDLIGRAKTHEQIEHGLAVERRGVIDQLAGYSLDELTMLSAVATPSRLELINAAIAARVKG